MLPNNGIKLMHYSTTQKTQIELFNTNYNKTIIIRARKPVVNFMTFNEGTENFDINMKNLTQQNDDDTPIPAF